LKKTNKDSVQKQQTALVFNLSGLGDTLLFLPALSLLKAQLPELRVVSMTMLKSCRDLLTASPLVDEVLYHPILSSSFLKNLFFFMGLRGRHFDYGILPYASNRIEYNVASFLCGAQKRMGHRYQLDPYASFTDLNHVIIRQVSTKHSVEENRDLLVAGGLLNTETHDLSQRNAITIPETDDQEAGAFFQKWIGRTIVGIHAGCNTLKNQHRRCYPPEKFARVLNAIQKKNPDVFFAIFSGDADRALTSQLVPHLEPTSFEVIEPRSILVCAGLIRRCGYFISNDSGLMHLAAYMKVPIVAIFGPTNPDFVHPWDVSHEVVRRGLPCQPCFNYSRRPLSCKEGIDFSCITDLAEMDVVNAFQKLRLK